MHLPSANASPNEVLVLLAGGEARRLPGKAERVVEGISLVVRQYRRFAPVFPVAISLAKPLSSDVMEQLPCTFVYDRHPKRGPLGGMLSACEALSCERILVLAVDTPLATTETLEALCAARRDGDEAVVATAGGRLEPLVALYDRRALLREAAAVLEHESGAVHRVIRRLRVRTVPVPAEQVANLNTPEDWEATFGSSP